jgi:hypothetical protein
MMSKYTREQIISERRCGLKYFDKAADGNILKADLIEDAINISKRHPDIWGGGWSNVQWALMNAVIARVASNRDIMQSWNLDEVLNQEEMKHVAESLNLDVAEYKPTWSRKVLKRKPKKN